MHRVHIDEESYLRLKNYCKENGLKMGHFTSRVIKAGLRAVEEKRERHQA